MYHARSSDGRSPWSLRERLGLFLWEVAWPVLCGWTPKPCHPWRRVVLRAFGARLEGRPFVHQRARIQIPWQISLGDRACVGDRAHLYSLDHIEIGPGAIIAQEAYLCTGDHDLADPGKPLRTAPITVGADAFVGARALILPGLVLGERAVVGAGAVVTRDVPADTTVAGNPARPVG